MKEELSPESRVWIYQANRPLSNGEVDAMRPLVREFAKEWVAHGADLDSDGDVLYNHFVVLMVDETRNAASGCSIDTSTRFIKEIEEQFDVALFDRLTIALWIDQEVRLTSKGELSAMLESGTITSDAQMFDNTVQTKDAFDSSWLVPIKDSWLSKSLNLEPVN